MKKLVLILAALVAQTAQANDRTVTKTVISAQQFVDEVRQMKFEDGDLESIGGSCSLVIQKQEDKDRIVLQSDRGFSFSVPVNANLNVEVQTNHVADGSGATTYKFGPARELTLLYVDVAYEIVTLKYNGTTLTCGIYF